MKPFALNRRMLTLGGAFYPTGWIVAMVGGEHIQRLAQALSERAVTPEGLMHLPPEQVLRELGGAVGESDLPLPSVGTEGQSVRKYLALARQGQHALMVHAPGDEDTERVMQVLRQVPVSYAQKYHRLMIEDLQ